MQSPTGAVLCSVACYITSTLDTLFQLLGLLTAVLIFPLVIWVPGWLLAKSCNVLDFDQLPFTSRLALPLLLSMAVSPLLVYLAARYLGPQGVWGIYAVIWVLAIVSLVRQWRDFADGIEVLWKDHWRGGLILLAWILGCSLAVIDLILPNDIWRNLNIMDSAAHVAFTDSITRTGVPPTNPFTYPGQPIRLFYYYYWYLICSLVDQLGGAWIPARAAVQAGSIYVGLAIAGLIVVFTNLLQGRTWFPGSARHNATLGWILLGVTGLDLIPWTFLHLIHRFFQLGPGGGVSLEHWNEQVTAWMGAVVMSPHHPAALVMGFTAILLLVRLCDGGLTGWRWWIYVALIGVAMSSAAGVSLYVTMALGLGLGIWTVWMLKDGSQRQTLLGLVAAGALALVLYAPFALELRSSSKLESVPLQLSVRAFEVTDYWLPSIVKVLKQWPASRYWLRLLFLPLNYFLEFGYFAVAALLYWIWRRKLTPKLDSVEKLLISIAVSSFTVCTFLSSTFKWNDLGWRAFLVAQFVLLLWAIPVTEWIWTRTPELKKWRSALLFLLITGIAGTTVEMINFRLRSIDQVGPQGVASYEAYRWVEKNTTVETIVAFNPDAAIDYFNSLYGNRQAVSGGRYYGTHFAVGEMGAKTLEDSLQFFGGKLTEAQRNAFLDNYKVGAIVVQMADPIWADKKSWVWKQTPDYANAGARVFKR